MTTKTVRIPSTIPCIPIDKVLLPGLVMQVTVGQKETIALLEKMYRKEVLDRIVVCAPMRATARSPPEGSETKKIRDAEEEAGDASGVSSFFAGDHAESRRSNEFTNTEDLFEFGCAARVLRLEKKKGTFRLVVEGLLRVRIDHYPQTLPFLLAGITPYPDPPISRDNTELFSLGISLKATAREIMTLLEELQIPHTVISNMKSLIDKTPSGLLADMLVSMVNASYEEKLSILGMVDMKERLTKAIEHLTKQIQILRISQKVHTTVQGNLGKKQREFYLRQQLNAIKAELGEKDSPEDDDEIAELSKRLMEAGLPPEADKVAKRELKRLKKMPQMMAEYQVIRTYLDLLCELPWTKKTETVMDMEHARKQLEDDHYGLDPVKKRIMEFLTVLKLKGNLRGPILCLIGPPGVGKTSLGRSIAAALGRKFHRISLGGVRDEAEIRGHRRTYVGALPGLIIQGIRKCKARNPVILLDEIDKVGTSNHQGDPSAALLEVLDPEQNSTFADHYLNMPFDLSEILFIATANTSDTIAAPLLDRMEVIGIPGYTFSEKRHIAARHLVPKQAKAHGLEPENVVFSDKVLARIAEGYTREAGVRGLEREIAAVCRIKAVEFADSVEKEKPDAYRKEVGEEDIEPYLGVEKFDDEVRARTSVPGIVTGLAWTSLGSGGILFIEATRMPGRGRLKLTGKLGEVIKESAQIGLSWVTANAYRLGVSDSTSADLLSSQDVHIHMPAGSVPKDGPSAGATIVTALVSLFSDTPVPPTVAMTGEITLRGLILPVGGIKEKVIAAHRAGLEKVLLPDRCRKDLKEVPEEVLKDLKFVFVKDIWEVLREVFPEEKRWPRSSVAKGDDTSARFDEDGIRRNAMSCRL